MKKLLLLLGLWLLPISVFAASGSIKASVSSTKVTLNNTVTVTVKVSSSDTLGSWQFNISYDKNKLSLQSGDTSIVGYGDGTYSSKSYTYKFKAINTGNANISIDNAKIIDWNSESSISTSISNLTLSIKEPVVINYSSDNNLKSLVVDGFDLNPVFDKSTLEYNVTVLPTTTKIKINAEKNDATAKVSGTGEKNVTEGNNSFEIVVTAENGITKTYKINVLVPEKDPIKYTFNNIEYSILRKLPESIPLNYTPITIKFNDEDIAALQNDKLNITLIYLRDNKNQENFYIYDSVKKTINKYNEISNNDLNIYITEPIKEIKNMIKITIKINNQEVNAYQVQLNSKDYIIYGKDSSTGIGNYYVYDKDNQTISIFNQNDYEYLLNNNILYKYVTYALGLLIFILIIIIILINNSKKKLTKIFNSINNKRLKKKDKNE